VEEFTAGDSFDSDNQACKEGKESKLFTGQNPNFDLPL
jgi:hypothetical protein